jgi:leader peptidase (prepilin peptidase) / N-methyltransferase
VTASVLTTDGVKSGRMLAAGIVGAAAEAGMVWRFGWSASLPAFLYFGAVAALVGASDLTERLVPNRVILPAYLIGPALLLLGCIGSGKWVALGRAGLAMAAVGGFFLALALVFPRGMGMGDCKLAGVVGLYLGWIGWSEVLTGVLLGYLGAALIVIALRAVGSSIGRGGMPFAPFMAGGALFVVLFVR